ncbi:alpha/beta fold hydrolase [Actinoplanes sp. NBC_00393]|uniref:alpha/beta hydrolase n=1 Tax=Actinoplanes sp. NBC_00393 TaxID=2975953 RepID=UPI002E1C00B9
MTLSRRQMLGASAVALTASTAPLVPASASASPAAGSTSGSGRPKPLIIREQGSFSAGGTVKRAEGVFNPKTPFDPQGQTLHGDHASVRYQIPEGARRYPLVFLHGAGQSARCWETTPDGRDGFQNIFLRRGRGVYLVDQPRRGQAGQSTEPGTIPAETADQNWFTQFRIGLWPGFYPGVQFPRDEESLNQFFRQMTPNTGPYNDQVISDAMAAVFQRSGPGILVTHSQGGTPGWRTAMKSSRVRAIVAYEPGGAFTFPDDEMPEPIPNNYATVTGVAVPRREFLKLTEIPIVVYYGDNIPRQPSDIPARDYWRAVLQMARRWADLINRNGGDVTVVHLPDEGIRGNTHFLFSDLNNVEVADRLSRWLRRKRLG